LGGVLLNLDMNRTRKGFEKLGMKDFNEHYNHGKQTGVFDWFESGKISAHEFRNELKKHLPPSITDLEIDAAWNAMLLDLPMERLDLLKSLSKNYRLFLLSNTNEIHFKAFSKYLKTTFGFSDFSGFFEQQYFSHLTGMRKPNAEIFELVLTENKLIANETLFIDDSLHHVEGSKKVGITGLHLQKGETVMDLFHDGKLIPKQTQS
jgi:putative hydrolase of the HAD superfamily